MQKSCKHLSSSKNMVVVWCFLSFECNHLQSMSVSALYIVHILINVYVQMILEQNPLLIQHHPTSSNSIASSHRPRSRHASFWPWKALRLSCSPHRPQECPDLWADFTRCEDMDSGPLPSSFTGMRAIVLNLFVPPWAGLVFSHFFRNGRSLSRKSSIESVHVQLNFCRSSTTVGPRTSLGSCR